MSWPKVQCPKCGSKNGIFYGWFSEDFTAVADAECPDCKHREHIRIGEHADRSRYDEVDARWPKVGGS